MTENVVPVPSIKEIVIISAPRSGTNFFCDAVGDLNEVMGFAEIFNPAGVFGAKGANVLAHLSHRLDASITEVSDRRLISFFRTEPLEALRVLGDAARLEGARLISYKIFPGQLKREDFARLLESPSRTVLFIVRRRLDTYISLEKARHASAWMNVDTADTLPTIDACQFMNWAKEVDKWFDDCVQLVEAHGKPFKIAQYDQDVDVPKLTLMRNIEKNLRELGVDVTMPPGRVPTRFKRQDRAIGPFKKIANGEELRAELRSMKQYDYALGHPISEKIVQHQFVNDGIAAEPEASSWNRSAELFMTAARRARRLMSRR